MIYKLLLGLTAACFSLSACSTKKTTKVSEDRFREEISKIEEHYYESATIQWTKESVFKDKNSVVLETLKEEDTFLFRAATQEEIEDAWSGLEGISFVYGFVCESHDNHDGLFTVDVDSYLVPSVMYCSNHLLNGDYILNFYKDFALEMKCYIRPFKLTWTFGDDLYLECTYNKYGYATHALYKNGGIIIDDGNKQVVVKEEVSIEYK